MASWTIVRVISRFAPVLRQVCESLMFSGLDKAAGPNRASATLPN
jgi:hypothetical protein